VDGREQTASVRQQYEQIYRYVRRRSRSIEEAEDVTQQVFADAQAVLDLSIDRQPRVLALLYRVAQRRLADEARRGIRERRRETPSFGQAPQSEYGEMVAHALRDAIANLPAGQRRVVVMRLLEERSFAEIAKRLGVTEAAAKMRLVRGLEAVRERLRQEGIEP
jgi:RNA polymerase sigma-70 factor (ECF subfamily)